MKKAENLSTRQHRIRVLGGLPMLIIGIVIVAVLAVLGLTDGSGNTQRILIKMCLYCTMACMWNLLSGFTGMTSLGQQSFIGVAGYSMAIMTATYGMSYVVGWIVGGAIGAVLALILSLILFRMRGMYFAIATWVIAEALKTWFNSWEFVNMGGGMFVRGRPDQTIIFVLSLVLCVVAIVLIYFLLNSKLGLGLTAMRDDADAASSVGVNIFRSKLICFVIAGLFCALAGGMYYLNNVSVYPTNAFGISWTVSLVFIVIIGGVGTMAGPIVGTVVYIALDEVLANFPGWSNIILGLIAILIILFLPDGILGTLQKKLHFEILSQRRFSKE